MSARKKRWKARGKKVVGFLKMLFVSWWKTGGKEKVIKKVKSKLKK